MILWGSKKSSICAAAVALLCLSGCSGYVDVTILNNSGEPIYVEFDSAECKVTVPARTKLKTGCKHFTGDVSLRLQTAIQTDWTVKTFTYKEAAKGGMAPSEIYLQLP